MKNIVAACILLAVTTACEKNETKPVATSASASPGGKESAAPQAALAKDMPATSTNAQAVEVYRVGVDLSENAREDAAREQFKKALALDPKFSSAMAMVGATTPGPEGDKMIADALAQGSALPEAEQVHMRLAQALHASDTAKAVEQGKKLTELLPGSWRSHSLYGVALNVAGRWEDATTAFKKALEVEPTAAVLYNNLGYLELQHGKVDDAVVHLKKYAELLPKEPNAHDSLAEALLLGGKYDEAEAAFKKAIELDPKFVEPWSGVGFAHFYKGDWAGGYDAFAKFRDAAPNVSKKGPAFFSMAWAAAAQGKTADALKALDAWDVETAKTADAEAGLWAALTRSAIYVETGKIQDGVKLLGALADRIEKADAPAPKKLRWNVYRNVALATASARLAKAPDAEKARAAVEELVGKSDDAELKGKAAYARGQAALAKNDAKAAAEAFKGCQPFDDFCSWERMKAQEKSGDKAASQQTREALQKTHRREALGFFVWTKVAPPPAKP